MTNPERWTASFFPDSMHDERASELRRFRKEIFIDQKGWRLNAVKDEEWDEYDARGAMLCALWRGSHLVGGFRAQRCDRPYLSRDVFSHLAAGRSLPTDSGAWEISRFGVSPTCPRGGTKLYALLIDFAKAHSARSLVAVVDLQHERLMSQIGIVTRRYGPAAQVGENRKGRPLYAVLGEIRLADQCSPALRQLARHLENVDISHETLVF
jgi:acyl homoserine lactone synthase